MRWAWAWLLAASGALAQPKPYTAEYDVLRNGKPLGRGTVTLVDEGETWHLTSVTRGTQGLASIAGVEIVEASTLRWRDGKPETIDYRYTQQAAWKTRERGVRVDAERGRILSREKDKSHDFDYRPYAIDRQVVALAMANDLARGSTREKLTYRVVDRDRFGPQTYRVRGVETVQTPAGPQEAVRLERNRKNGRSTTTWLGTRTGYVPVRVVQREPDGETYEMRLLSLRR